MTPLGDLPSALDVGLVLAQRLRTRGISHALGGALALGVSGILRATRDIDINVFATPGELDPVLEVFEELGVAVDRTAAKASAEQEGMFILWAGPWRIDVFVPSIDFSWEAERTRLEISVEGAPHWFLSPEALTVFKLLFFRPKDLLDLEQLLAIRPDLDVAWVRVKLVEMMGVDDPRVAEWDRLVQAAPSR